MPSPRPPAASTAKKINGRKRHIAVDTLGLPVMITVTPADMTDRDAARELLRRLRVMQPQITQVWADSAYAGQLVNWSEDFLKMTLRTVSRPRGAKGFVVLPDAGKSNAPSAGSRNPAATSGTTNGCPRTAGAGPLRVRRRVMRVMSAQVRWASEEGLDECGCGTGALGNAFRSRCGAAEVRNAASRSR
ncbi:transposase [Streptomyces sp. XY332]|uniref:transposase n=1 Tax=Streptomyces sp. XY332 TaxID=1415561 RepID=UPI00099B5326